MAYVIKDVSLSKNVVTTGEKVLLSVTILTWDFLKKNYTYDTLEESDMKWGDMIRSDE